LAVSKASRIFRCVLLLGFSPGRDHTSYDPRSRLNDIVFQDQLTKWWVLIGYKPFEFVLVVSGLRVFQQACFLYSNSCCRQNLPSHDRVTIFGYSTRATLRNDGGSTLVESRFLPNDSTPVTINYSSQTHFHKISKHLTDKPSSFAQKELRFLCFSDDQYWRKFSVLTVS